MPPLHLFPLGEGQPPKADQGTVTRTRGQLDRQNHKCPLPQLHTRTSCEGCWGMGHEAGPHTGVCAVGRIVMEVDSSGEIAWSQKGTLGNVPLKFTWISKSSLELPQEVGRGLNPF